jgi:hypothetical protein
VIWLLACADPLPPPPPVPEPTCALTYQALVETEQPVTERHSDRTRTLVEFVLTGDHVAPAWVQSAFVDEGLAVPLVDPEPVPAVLPQDSSQWTGLVWPHLAMVLDRDQTHLATPNELGALSDPTLIPMERTEWVVGSSQVDGRPAVQTAAVWQGATRQMWHTHPEDMGRVGTAQLWWEGTRLLHATTQERAAFERGGRYTQRDGTVEIWLVADCEGPVLSPATVWSPTERMLQRWNVLEQAVHDGDRATARDQAVRVFSSGVLQAHGTDGVLGALSAFYDAVPTRVLKRAWVHALRGDGALDRWSMTTAHGAPGLVRIQLNVHPVSGAIRSLGIRRDADPAMGREPATLRVDAETLFLSLPPSPDP